MRPLMALTLLSFLAAPAFAQDVETTTPLRSVQSMEHARQVSEAVSSRTLSEAGGQLLAAGLRQGSRLATGGPSALQETPRGKPRRWISRHPALFGALVGAGAGAIASGTMENELFCSGGDEDCFFHGGSRLLVGAGMGAAVGVLVGWLGSL